jgi:hypothetical protein
MRQEMRRRNMEGTRFYARKGNAMKGRLAMNNEEGSVLIVSMMMLVVLTVIGIFASTTSQIEIKLGGNERAYKQDLYFADAAGMECAQILQDYAGNLQTAGPTWLFGRGVVSPAQILDVNNTWWKGTHGAGNDDNSVVSMVDGNTRYMTTSEGVCRGCTLSMGSATIHQYYVYSRRRRPSGATYILEVGFRKAF